MSLALLFPGQGAQRPDMLDALPDSPAVTAVLDESRTQLSRLGQADNTQIDLVIAGVACARALTDDYGLTARFVAGHSVGAFAAAVAAGVLTLAEALAAVALRATLMAQACEGGEWGMAAVTGLPTRSVNRIAEQVGTQVDPLWTANVNSATQTVLSGTAVALSRAEGAAKAAGATKYERLDVPVASHCPLQQHTADRMAEDLAKLPRRTPTATYLTNTGGRAVSTADAVLDDLAGAVAHPVRWYDAARLMAELGVTCAIEAQPGHTLTRLMESAAPGVTAIALQENAIGSAVARAERAG